MGTGTDIAMESAGITLLKGDLEGILRARKLSQATMRNIRQNLLFAFLYNADRSAHSRRRTISGIRIAAKPDSGRSRDELQLSVGNHELVKTPQNKVVRERFSREPRPDGCRFKASSNNP
jgi:hypothetical protein